MVYKKNYIIKKMEYLTRPVVYLDSNDFDDEGNIINPLLPKDKPIFIMLQANFCGFCKMAKPDFQEFAEKNPNFVVASIQADSKNPDVVKLKNKINKIYPNLVGFPSYMIYAQGKRIIYNGGRSYKDLQTFADGFPAYLNSISEETSQPSTTGP